MIIDIIPGELEWGEAPNSDDFDLQSAHKDFYGKTVAELQNAFSRNVIELAYSMRFIPPKPFQFYMRVFSDFVKNGLFDESDAADVASNFLKTIEFKLLNDRSSILPIMEYLFPVVEYVTEKQVEFEADSDVYGDFFEQKDKIKEMWKK